MAVEGIPPIILTHLNYLFSRSPLAIKVDQMWSGSKNNVWLDRFALLIPFCLDYVKWDIIYNLQSPLAAPDVIFGAEDENFRSFLLSSAGETDPKMSALNTLANWNYKDPSRLLTFVLQLRELYSAYQKKKVAEVDDERLQFELCTVLSRDGIEMWMSTGADKAEEVKFSVSLLDMDINKMVPFCSWRQPQKIYLQVIYPVARKYVSSSTTPPRLKLVSTPELKSLFPVEDVKLPSWLDGMCLAEYLPAIEDTLQLQIVEAVAQIGARRRFIEALAPVFGRPLEADPIFCRKATALVANGPFTFLVHFHLPIQFPKLQPILVLQSSLHFNAQNKPIRSHDLSDYPWSPRWDAPTMAERIFEFLVDESINFRKYCNDAVLQH